jgi:hypothetical protein
MLYFYLVLFLFYAVALILPGIGDPIPLFAQGDEIMHIRSVRETIAHESWILPELSGLPNPYKPPLLFWLGILSDHMFGISFFSERLTSFLFGLGSTFLVFQILRTYGRSNLHSFLIALSYAATFGTWKFSRLLMMEQGMAFFVLCFLWFYLRYDKANKIKYLFGASFSLGLGYFLKGPIIIIYGIIIAFSFFFVDVLRIRRKSYYLNIKNISKYLSHSVLLVSFFLPLVWLAYLYFFEERGKQLIHFFFINENAGKFNSENQSAFRIFGGWILYGFPLSLTLISSIIIQIKNRISSRRTRVVRSLIVSVFFFTIFHLLPNRKDSYYIVAFLPIVFVSMGLSHSFENFKSLFLSRWNLAALLLFLSIFILFSYWNHQIYAMVIFSFYFILIFISFYESWRYFVVAYVVSILLIPSFSFLILQQNLDPLISEELDRFQIKKYCLISENPWNGMEYQNQSPTAEIIYSPPSTGKFLCENQNLAILSLSSFYSPEGKYKTTKEWHVWKSHYNFDLNEILELLRNPIFLKYKTKIKLYEVDEL